VVAADNGDGRLGYLVLFFQINDCYKSVNQPVANKKFSDSADDVLSVVNCVTAVSNGKVKEILTDRLGLDPRTDRTGKTFEDKAKPLLGAFQKVFKFIAAAEITVTLSTAVNDFNMASESDKYLQFSPAGEDIKAFDAAPWSLYVTPDRRHEFIIPSGWKVVPGAEQQYPVPGQNLAVVNKKGETMSVFQTGWMQPMGQSRHPGMEDMFRDIDATRVSGLKPVLDNTENMFAYPANNFAEDRWNATMGIHSFLKTDTKRIWSRGFDISKQGLATIGGTFGRSISEDTVLTDVSADTKGVGKLYAYYSTDEYYVIKTMLRSLSDHAQ
jgi:hypothetical protein